MHEWLPRRFSRRVVLEQVLGWTGALAAMTWVHENDVPPPVRVEPPARLISADQDTVGATSELLRLIARPLVDDVDLGDVLLEWSLPGDRRSGTDNPGTSSPLFTYGQQDEVVSRIGFDPFRVTQALTVRRAADEVTIVHGGLATSSLARTWAEEGYTERPAPFGRAYWLRDADAWSKGFLDLEEPWSRMRGVLDFAGIIDGQTICFSSSEEVLLDILETLRAPASQEPLSRAAQSAVSMFGVLPRETAYAFGKVGGSNSVTRSLDALSDQGSGPGARLDGYLITEQSRPARHASGPLAHPTHLIILHTDATSVLPTIRNEVEAQWSRGRSRMLDDEFATLTELDDVSIDIAADAVLVWVTYTGNDTDPIIPVLSELIGVSPD